MWMADPNQAGSLQGSQGVSLGILAANNPGTGSGWQQSKQNWVLPAVVGYSARMTSSCLCCVEDSPLHPILYVSALGASASRGEGEPRAASGGRSHQYKRSARRRKRSTRTSRGSTKARIIQGLRWRPYRVEYTGSLLTSEVKPHRARLVLGWGTAREHLRVLPAFCLRNVLPRALAGGGGGGRRRRWAWQQSEILAAA